MKKYISYFKIYFANILQYRISAYAGVITQFVFGIMQITIYITLAKENPDTVPMNIKQITTYIWLQQMFLQMFVTWCIDKDILNMIRSGNVSYELCRPVDLYDLWFIRSASKRLSKAILRSIPMFIIAVLLPYPYKFYIDVSIINLVFFFITMFLSFMLLICLTMIVFGIVLKTVSSAGIVMFASIVIDFFAGVEIPLPFFPEYLQGILKYLPFTYLQNVPFRIFGNGMNIYEIKHAIVMQLFWIFVVFIGGKIIFKRSEKRICVLGG